MKKLILVRHGQSEWNLENRFTGWKNVDLTPKGRLEAKAAGELLKQHGYEIDQAFTSFLTRAIHTCQIALDALDQAWIPVTKAWQLNERHYGALTGLNKAETIAKHGEDQVHIWRRSYDVAPAPLAKESEFHPCHEQRYRHLDSALIPDTESLATTLLRVLPYWETEIVPCFENSSTIMIVAHGNSLRALIKHLDNVDQSEITQVEIPTGQPLIYELDDQLNAKKHYFLKDI